ncbi:hypothetical protein D3C79_608500 [compost metagenome]
MKAPPTELTLSTTSACFMRGKWPRSSASLARLVTPIRVPEESNRLTSMKEKMIPARLMSSDPIRSS